MFDALDISGSALSAERMRMDVIAENIAHAQTTRVEGQEGPYRRKHVILAERQAEQIGADPQDAGVQVAGVVEDQSPPRMVHDPSHPDADERGYVQMPNVDVPTEMVDMVTASRAYEANAKAARLSRQASEDALSILG
jgi:flagellar basal-body rod protein FlgC